MGIYDDFMKQQSAQNTSPGGGGIYERFMAQQSGQDYVQPIADNQEKSIGDIVANVASAASKPVATALEAISYFDKPRGAIAGAVKAYQDDTPLLEGAAKGWKENTSWKETFNQDWVKENPTAAAVLGFAADVVGDPLVLLTPAKIARALKIPEAAGAVKTALERSETGRALLAGAEDLAGVNRVASALGDQQRGRAIDQVVGGDYVDAAKALKKEFGEGANVGTKYVEALNRPTTATLNADGSMNYLSALEQQKAGLINDTLDTYAKNPGGKGVIQGNLIRDEAGDVVGRFGRQSNNPEWYQEFWKEYGHAPTGKSLREFAEKQLSKYSESGYDDLISEIDSVKRHLSANGDAEKAAAIVTDVKMGKAAKMMKIGFYTREDAFNALRNFGEEIPDWLLQTHQRQAKMAGEAIPDYIYRDQVLASVENPRLRAAIQKQLDPFIEYNQKLSDKLHQLGRIGDESYVEFMGGSHLRRSYEKWDNADAFLKDLKKHGTDEEWQRAYIDLTKRKADAQGFGQAHKINTRDFMKRQTLSDETLKKMGIINDPEYRIMDTLNRASKTIREDEFLKRVDGMFGKSAEEAAMLSRNLPDARKYVPVPEGEAYGALAGKWVPADVLKQVMGTMGATPDNLNKTWAKMVSWWKVGKLANPASAARNFYSGLPMATEFGRVPFYALPREIGRVISSFKDGGKNNAFIREFRMSGALEGDWAKSAL